MLYYVYDRLRKNRLAPGYKTIVEAKGMLEYAENMTFARVDYVIVDQNGVVVFEPAKG